MPTNNSYSTMAVLKAMVDEGTRALKIGGGGIRDFADDALLEQHATAGVDRVRIYVNNQPVGTHSVRVTPAKTEQILVLADLDAFCEWLTTNEDGMNILRSLIVQNQDKVMAQALTYAKGEGVLPDGCDLYEDTTTEHVAGTTLRVDHDKVAAALDIPEGQSIVKALMDKALSLPEAEEL